MRRTHLLRTALLPLATCGLLLLGGAADAAPAKLSHAQAARMLHQEGIDTASSGNCTDVNNRKCTSLEGINRTTITGIIRFKKISRCDVRITGGTECGAHNERGKYTHRNGYKVDLSIKDEFACATAYVKKNFKRDTPRPNGDAVYHSPNGNLYALESNHWDVLFYNGSA
jgi:hypothetical protein